MQKKGRQDKGRGPKDQLEAHSLPGINQAGKGPGSCDEQETKRTGDDSSPAPEGRKEP